MARFTVSIDDNLKEQLDQYAKNNDYNRSEALEKILAKHFSPEKEPAQDPAPKSEPEPQDPQQTPEDSRALSAIYAQFRYLHIYLNDLHKIVCKNSESIQELQETDSYEIPDTVPVDPYWMTKEFPVTPFPLPESLVAEPEEY